MKSTVALIVVALIAASECRVVMDNEHKETFEKAMKECMTDSRATDKDFREMIAEQPAISKEGKCLKSCLMKKFSTMNVNGKMSKEESMAVAKAIIKNNTEQMEIAKEIINACVDLKVPEDHCEAAELYYQCMTRTGKELGITSIEVV